MSSPIGMGAFGGPGANDLGGQQDEPDDDTLMQELMEAAQAGDNAETDGMFSQVPGADGGEQKPAGGGMDPAMLQQLMEMLKEKQGGADASMPPSAGGM